MGTLELSDFRIIFDHINNINGPQIFWPEKYIPPLDSFLKCGFGSGCVSGMNVFESFNLIPTLQNFVGPTQDRVANYSFMLESPGASARRDWNGTPRKLRSRAEGFVSNQGTSNPLFTLVKLFPFSSGEIDDERSLPVEQPSTSQLSLLESSDWMQGTEAISLSVPIRFCMRNTHINNSILLDIRIE